MSPLRRESLKGLNQMNRFLGTFVLLACVLSMASARPKANQAGGDAKAEPEIRQMESRRIQAMLRVDTEELNRVLADDLTYVHSSGQVDSKAQLIDSLQSGQRKYESIQPEDVKVRVYGEAAVVTGRAQMKTKSQGQDFNFRVRFTDVYVKKAGSWQMVAWQSSRLPEQ
jgi:ketosteroid isomerase-like protein